MLYIQNVCTQKSIRDAACEKTFLQIIQLFNCGAAPTRSFSVTVVSCLNDNNKPSLLQRDEDSSVNISCLTRGSCSCTDAELLH